MQYCVTQFFALFHNLFPQLFVIFIYLLIFFYSLNYKVLTHILLYNKGVKCFPKCAILHKDFTSYQATSSTLSRLKTNILTYCRLGLQRKNYHLMHPLNNRCTSIFTAPHCWAYSFYWFSVCTRRVSPAICCRCCPPLCKQIEGCTCFSCQVCDSRLHGL